MNLNQRITDLKKQNIPFEIIDSHTYKKPSVSIIYREKPCMCTYEKEDFIKETGKHICSGTCLPNKRYSGEHIHLKIPRKSHFEKSKTIKKFLRALKKFENLAACTTIAHDPEIIKNLNITKKNLLCILQECMT
jgi:hypothetical protein